MTPEEIKQIEDNLLSSMEANTKKQLDDLANQDNEIKANVAEQEAKDKKAFEEQESELKKRIKESEDAIKKQIEETKEKSKEIITDEKPVKVSLSKMTEAQLIEYGISIRADVNKKYTKAKNLENVKLKQQER